MSVFFLRGTCRAVVFAFIFPVAVRAQTAGVPDTPVELAPADTVDAGPAPVDAPAALTPQQVKDLERELQQQAPAPATPTAVPDLSQVNLAASIPGIQSMNPDMAVILDFAGAGFSAEPLQTGGHDPDHNGFTLRQVELALGASVDPYFRFDADLVFKDGVEVEEAYLTTSSLPWSLQVRAGEFFSRFGRQNAQHPHSWNFVDQPLVYGKFLGEDGAHGKGAELSWLAPLPWALTVYGTVQSPSGPCCAASYSPTDASTASVRTALDLVYEGVVEQFFPITDSLSVLWGLSTQAGPAQYLASDGRAELQGTDVLVRYKPDDSTSRWSVELQAEALLRTRHAGSKLLVDEGGYAQGVWRINPEWETGLRYELLNGIARDGYDASGLGPLVQRGAGQVTFYPSHFSRLRFEASVGDRHDGSLPVVAGIIDVEVLIGAHGSHSY